MRDIDLPARSVWDLLGPTALGLLLPNVMGAFATLGSYFPIGLIWPFSYLFDGPIIVLTGLAITAAIPIGGALLSVYALSWRPIAMVVVFGVAMFFGVGMWFTYGDAIERLGFTLFARRSADLIEAITKYEASSGRPPETLAHLMQSYLKTFPDTAMSVDRTYDYASSHGPCSAANRWHLMVSIGLGELVYCPAHDLSDAGNGFIVGRYEEWVLIRYPD